jgi:hypothetical protein
MKSYTADFPASKLILGNSMGKGLFYFERTSNEMAAEQSNGCKMNVGNGLKMTRKANNVSDSLMQKGLFTITYL